MRAAITAINPSVHTIALGRPENAARHELVRRNPIWAQRAKIDQRFSLTAGHSSSGLRHMPAAHLDELEDANQCKESHASTFCQHRQAGKQTGRQTDRHQIIKTQKASAFVVGDGETVKETDQHQDRQRTRIKTSRHHAQIVSVTSKAHVRSHRARR